MGPPRASETEKSSRLESNLTTSPPRAPKKRKAAFWSPFRPCVHPGPQSVKRQPKHTYIHSLLESIWPGSQNIEKQPFGVDLAMGPTRAPKHRKVALWSQFWPWVWPGVPKYRKTAYIHTHIYLHTYIPTYIHTYLHTYIHTYTHTCTQRNT